MLNTLRKSAASWVMKGLFGILVLSFAVWGIGDIFRGPGRDTIVIEVGDRGITGQELITAYQRYIAQMQPAFRGKLDAELAETLGFRETVIRNLVSGAVFDVAAGDLGLAVSDDLVRENILNNPAFKGPGGAFDTLAFEQAYRQAGFSEEAYVAALRRDLASNGLVTSIIAGASAPRSMREALYRLRGEERVAEAVLVADASITGVGEPGEAALEVFHREHAERFTAPEYRALTVVSLDLKALADEITVSDDELRQLYDDSFGRFTTPERRNLRQILLDDEVEASRARKMLAEGRDFAEVAKEIAGKEEADLVIGWITKGGLPEPLAEAAFALEAGDISDPVKSALGWHILQATETEAQETRSFEEAKPELRAEIAEERVIDSIYSIANQFEDALAGGASLQEAAARVNLKPFTLEAVDREGGDARGQPIEGLPGGGFLKTAFATAKGEESLLTETPDGGYFMLRVDRVTPSALKPLESVRSQVAEAWRANERHKAAQARAQAMAEKVTGGAALNEVAAEMGLEVTTTEPFIRSTLALPPALVTKLFEAPIQGIATAEAADGYMLAQIKEIRPAEPGADKEGVERVTGQLREAFASDLLAQYHRTLYDQYEVEINRRAIDALF
ncbi:MAG: SurA N-terminal domain-containing protein [Alphaproteobacteria bacterium]